VKVVVYLIHATPGLTLTLQGQARRLEQADFAAQPLTFVHELRRLLLLLGKLSLNFGKRITGSWVNILESQCSVAFTI
jgi:hypothetical protein